MGTDAREDKYDAPEVMFVRFADNGNIREWNSTPFEGGLRYVHGYVHEARSATDTRGVGAVEACRMMDEISGRPGVHPTDERSLTSTPRSHVQRREPDNVGTSDRWEDPRDTQGGATDCEPRSSTQRIEHDEVDDVVELLRDARKALNRCVAYDYEPVIGRLDQMAAQLSSTPRSAIERRDGAPLLHNWKCLLAVAERNRDSAWYEQLDELAGETERFLFEVGYEPSPYHGGDHASIDRTHPEGK
jgi:hypothetical protein